MLIGTIIREAYQEDSDQTINEDKNVLLGRLSGTVGQLTGKIAATATALPLSKVLIAAGLLNPAIFTTGSVAFGAMVVGSLIGGYIGAKNAPYIIKKYGNPPVIQALINLQEVTVSRDKLLERLSKGNSNPLVSSKYLKLTERQETRGKDLLIAIKAAETAGELMSDTFIHDVTLIAKQAIKGQLTALKIGSYMQ